MIKDMQGPVFQETDSPQNGLISSADTSLWFFWTLQQCFAGVSSNSLWKKYGKIVTTILEGYAEGKVNGVSLHDNGLLHIDAIKPLTSPG
jgi:hypothetical protein